jgi:hypothetical protein
MRRVATWKGTFGFKASVQALPSSTLLAAFYILAPTCGSCYVQLTFKISKSYTSIVRYVVQDVSHDFIPLTVASMQSPTTTPLWLYSSLSQQRSGLSQRLDDSSLTDERVIPDSEPGDVQITPLQPFRPVIRGQRNEQKTFVHAYI